MWSTGCCEGFLPVFGRLLSVTLVRPFDRPYALLLDRLLDRLSVWLLDHLLGWLLDQLLDRLLAWFLDRLPISRPCTFPPAHWRLILLIHDFSLVIGGKLYSEYLGFSLLVANYSRNIPFLLHWRPNLRHIPYVHS